MPRLSQIGQGYEGKKEKDRIKISSNGLNDQPFHDN